MESPLHDAAGARLIETVLWDGAACPLLAWHRARLTDGARRLGWAAPRLDLIGPPGRPARLRVLCGPDGLAAPEVSDLPPPIALWRVGVAAQRLRSDDPWLRIKSTRRAGYDAARRDLRDDLDEVLLLNERGEVCDGSITTLFFDRGHGMRTPPAASGLLPGVLRAKMMAEGLREEVLLPADLPHLRLWLGNALRGLSPAVFRP